MGLVRLLTGRGGEAEGLSQCLGCRPASPRLASGEPQEEQDRGGVLSAALEGPQVPPGGPALSTECQNWKRGCVWALPQCPPFYCGPSRPQRLPLDAGVTSGPLAAGCSCLRGLAHFR